MQHAEVESRTTLPGDSLVSLQSILRTEELNRRPSRAPDYEADKCALVALAQALADSPHTILQTMAEKMLEIFQCDSAGFSLLTKDGKNFHWPAVAGMWQPHIGGGTPRNFGPCGDVLDCNRPLLFSHWERRYPYLLAAMPEAEEGLLVPFYVNGKAVGTIWVIAHNDRRKFDAEDMRQLTSLGSFASSAYQVVAFLDALEERDEALRQSCEKLEQRVKERTAKLSTLNQELQAEITKHRITVEQLTKTEERLHDIFGNTPVILFSLDRFGVINLSEGKGLDAFGVKPGELVGQSIFDLYHDSPDLHANARRALSGETVTFVTEFNNQFFDVHLIPILDDEGDVAAVTGVAYDITERKRAEEALRDSEEQWKATFESNPVMYFMADSTGVTLSVNTFGAAQLGYKRSELVGQPLFNVFYEADREQVRKGVGYCFQNLGRTCKWEARKVRKDGTVIWVRETANALLLKNRPVLLVVCEDITDRKRAEEAVRRSEKELRDLIGTIPAMVFATRADGSNEFVSRQWIEFSGLSGTRSRGSGWAATIHPKDREQHLAKWQAAQASGQPFEDEARYRDVHRNYRWLLVRAVPLRSEQGKILKWYGTAFDIEDRKRAEEALRASEQLARSHVEVMMRSLDVLATEAEPEKLTAEMLRTIGHRLRARNVLLWLRDPQDDSLHLRLVVEDGRQVAPQPDHPFVKDPHAWKRNLSFQEMLFTKGPVVCDDVEQDSRIGAELREYLMKRGRSRFLAIPMFVLGEVRGFLAIQHVERGVYLPEEIELAQALAHHVMIAAHETELGEQRRHAVILEERTRMAREIHDTLAQGFTGIIVQLEATASAISRSEPKKVSKCLQRASDLARRSLNEARRSVHALRPQALQGRNFWHALKDTIKNTTACTALHTTFAAQGKLADLPEPWQENVFRIGQEALTNTLKHAHARKFETRLTCKAKELRLELRDDGDGFKIKDRHDGIGLIGMQERVEQMGGKLKITSARGKGTKITVVLPFNEESMP